MPIIPLSVVAPHALDNFQDLRSVPPHRHFGRIGMIDRLRMAVAFDYISIGGLDLDHYRFGDGESVDTDMPPAFVDSYVADKLFLTDPLVAFAMTAVAPVSEADVYPTRPPSQRLQYLLRTFAIENRVFFPIRRREVLYGGICVTRSTPFVPEEIEFFRVLAPCLHSSITRPLMERFAAQHMKLTRGEIVCLAAASLGMTTAEIGTQTGYQSDTVNSYIKNATKKLGAANRSHAIAEAIRRRLID